MSAPSPDTLAQLADAFQHADDCDRCLACRIEAALTARTP